MPNVFNVGNVVKQLIWTRMTITKFLYSPEIKHLWKSERDDEEVPTSDTARTPASLLDEELTDSALLKTAHSVLPIITTEQLKRLWGRFNRRIQGFADFQSPGVHFRAQELDYKRAASQRGVDSVMFCFRAVILEDDMDSK